MAKPNKSFRTTEASRIPALICNAMAAVVLIAAVFQPQTAIAQESPAAPHFIFYLTHKQTSGPEVRYVEGEKLKFRPGPDEITLVYRMLSLRKGQSRSYQELVATPVQSDGTHDVAEEGEFCICIDIELNRVDNSLTLLPTLELSDGTDPYKKLEISRVLLNLKQVPVESVLENGRLRSQLGLKNLMQGRNTLQIYGRFVNAEAGPLSSLP